MSEPELLEIPARTGRAVRLPGGHAIKIVNTFGSQVVDTWALSTADPSEYLSMEQTRRMLFRLAPRKGDTLYSNRRNPMLIVEEDSSPGVHDTLLACCDRWVYEKYGCSPGHANCRDNFFAALSELGITVPAVPNPLNLWMNIPVRDNTTLSIEPPVSKPGDYVVLRALADAIVVLSTCPMDVTPINGPDCTPMAVYYVELM
jgi:uncharacterized protein YcgI (DUF1989 family)